MCFIAVVSRGTAKSKSRQVRSLGTTEAAADDGSDVALGGDTADAGADPARGDVSDEVEEPHDAHRLAIRTIGTIAVGCMSASNQAF
jgi:hypothetical protein